MLALTLAPVEPWLFRILHVMGALILGFLLFRARPAPATAAPARPPAAARGLSLIAVAAALAALGAAGHAYLALSGGALRVAAEVEIWAFGAPLALALALALPIGWIWRDAPAADLAAALSAAAASLYLAVLFDTGLSPLRTAAGTPFAPIGMAIAAAALTALILELTRRLAGPALVVIAALFVAYVFVGPHLPGLLTHPGQSAARFFSQIYTDSGVLGPTTDVSSRYIMLFIVFAAFLQVSGVGAYFVDLAFSAAGGTRGGPAKVAIFASGLMGMINGTSAGNVAATGALTIPMMKRSGYTPKTAGAVEAAASTGGQIMPPIMGAGAFIMAEITRTPYLDIAAAALIPAALYVLSVLAMVDANAARRGLVGAPRAELPALAPLLRQLYLFAPIVILIGALLLGYTVIRAGALAIAATAAVSWLTPHAMGPRAIARAFAQAGETALQIILVCAAAGLIVGVISATGVGGRFSALLLDLAGGSQVLALVAAMVVAILLGMGMPTTAAYAVAASVVAPGLISIGVPTLTAHLFVFYFAVISAITPPVALAAYAAAGISGANPMATSVAAFRIGLVAFVVPFMFFFNTALLWEGSAFEIARAAAAGALGVYLLAAAMEGWFWGARAGAALRAALAAAALGLIAGAGLRLGGVAPADLAGLALAAAAALLRLARARAAG
ncbi:MAG: TRAP transporter fused permease subunit [Pseudomonadota bacterium]